ncbi:shikimate dehydrogenase family protein [Aspergillus aculeatinus CBS 121060]|uniref:NAD(P)-binding protein n=1 Tax=Aspergillus aculeatinus CBS 121060 TaxID=1448322 RepID=A0ACD1GSF2_9EURO|nr:NAD(P)-binding protein [Aspergillus aculeatinus CBS 121060]RAH64124.1 NAD(P)-binding protein [Aspergillus aculeatinus CBS 121060]
MTTPQTYHIFGQTLATSLSPTLHNAAFAHHRLPHHYTIQECPSLAAVQHLINAPTFGGASVTMPHKLAAFPLCDAVSDAARQIGAINTLIAETRDGKRVITGDNTDWRGLYELVVEYLAGCLSSSRDDEVGAGGGPATSLNPGLTSRKTGLVLGAGGAARAAVYALLQANFARIVVANRTVDKAGTIVRDFEGLAGPNGATCELVAVEYPIPAVERVRPDVVIGTVPGDVVVEADVEGLFAGQEHEHGHGLVVEMAYKPRVTGLMRAGQQAGWEVQDGLEVLLRQGFVQYSLWTGREAPVEVMRGSIEGEDPTSPTPPPTALTPSSASAIERENSSIDNHPSNLSSFKNALAPSTTGRYTRPSPAQTRTISHSDSSSSSPADPPGAADGHGRDGGDAGHGGWLWDFS